MFSTLGPMKGPNLSLGAWRPCPHQNRPWNGCIQTIDGNTVLPIFHFTQYAMLRGSVEIYRDHRLCDFATPTLRMYQVYGMCSCNCWGGAARRVCCVYAVVTSVDRIALRRSTDRHAARAACTAKLGLIRDEIAYSERPRGYATRCRLSPVESLCPVGLLWRCREAYRSAQSPRMMPRVGVTVITGDVENARTKNARDLKMRDRRNKCKGEAEAACRI